MADPTGGVTLPGLGGTSNSSDPYGTAWTPASRVAALTSAGYQWSPANPQGAGGPSALWVGPDGRTVLETVAFQNILAKPSTSADTSPSVDGSGRQYIVRNGQAIDLATGQAFQPAPMPVNPHPGSSSSYSVSQSYSDPAAIQIQRDSLAEQIRQADLKNAQDAQLLQFQRDRAKVEDEKGNKQLALQANTLAEQIQARVESNTIARSKMAQDMAQFDAQIAESQRQQASQQAFQGGENAANRTATANEGIASRNLSREQMMAQDRRDREALQLQRDSKVADFSANPADVGRISAMLQMGGTSPVSSALGRGETGITDRGLAPLADLLAPLPALPQYAMEQPQGPLNSAIAAGGQQVTNAAQSSYVNPYSDPNVGKGTRQTIDGNGQLWDYGANGLEKVGAPAAPANTGSSGPDGPAGGFLTTDPTTGAANWVKAMQDGGAVVQPGVLNGLMGLVQALGLEPKAIAGERGQASGETVYGDPDANIVVVPDKGKGGKAKGKKKMADGGADLGINDLLERARAFQQQTAQTALSRSGFENAPSPIELSDPGTNPYVRTLGASTTAAVKGIPQDVFMNELLKLVPQAQTFGLAGRTR